MPSQRNARSEILIDSILQHHPRFDQDLFQIDTHIWAIHGYIPVDGEVILAEFDHLETARAVLAQLAAAQNCDDLNEFSR
jgi:hypothetical protein